MILYALLLAGSQTADPVQVEITWDGKTCGTRVDGVPASQDDLDRHAQQWAKEERRVSLTGTNQTPYRCIGDMVYRLQMAGVTDIGFFSEPPPTRIDLAIPSGKCRVLLDGKPETLAMLRRHAATWKKTQPEINFQPDPSAKFQCVDRVLAIVKPANLIHFGFIGNAAPPEDAAPLP